MLQRDDLLRLARIIDYDRYFTPSLGMMNDPSFEYECVQASNRRPLDTGGYCIDWQMWKKAQKGTAYDPLMTKDEMERKMQHNEVRARKEMKTSELRTLLETLPLYFTFEDGVEVVVLPKLADRPDYKVYVKWNDTMYCEQRSLDFESDLHKKWFNSERAKSTIGQDWRALLQLNFPVIEDTNVLYKVFEGVYTGDLEQLEKDTEYYKKEVWGDTKKPAGIPIYGETKKLSERIKESDGSIKRKKKQVQNLHCNVEGQKKVCIKDPSTGVIFRINKFYTSKYIKQGWEFTSKEEYKEQQKLAYKIRKDKAEGNREEQMLKYRGPKQSSKGIPGSPFIKNQLIEVWPKDDKGKRLTEDDFETVTVKHLIPVFAYVPRYYEIWREGKLIIKEPLLDMNGNQLFKRILRDTEERYITFERKVKPTHKTIRVLQIPSKKTQLLNAVTKPSGKVPRPKGAVPVMSVIRFSKRFANKTYLEHKVGDPRN
jgi:hypothetical protein